ncbi:MAG: phosphotransferase family protein [Promethearchaeota archaeon]|jgi:aminoglycoside 2''-phosphotransferase
MIGYEESNPSDVDIHQVIKEISKFIPKISKNQIKFLYHGTHNVFEVKSKYIFRIPDRLFRNEKGIELIQKETGILNFLKNNISTTIPQPLFLSLTEDFPFVGYEKIPGVSLSRIFFKTNLSYKLKIAEQVASFLNVLHSKSICKKFAEEFKIRELLKGDSFKQYWIKRLERLRKVVFSEIKSFEQKWLERVFDEFLLNENNFQFSPNLVHGDFDITNILVNPDTDIPEITGIIDFEECSIYDPAYDLQFFDEGSEFLNTLLLKYEYSDDPSLHSRMKFLYCRTCIEYLEFGIDHNRIGMIEAGKRMLKKNMKMFPWKRGV